MPVRVTLRELQEKHREALETYGKRRTFFWWWRWLWGYPMHNNQRMNNRLIDGKAIRAVQDKLAAYDKKSAVAKFLYRLFTPIEKQRSLLCYYVLQKLSDENTQERDEKYYYAVLNQHAKKLRSNYLKPIASAFVNGLRPTEEPLYKRMHRPPSDELPRNPKFSKTQNYAVTPVGQAYDAKETKKPDIKAATPSAEALYQQYQFDMQELDKLITEVKDTLHQYKEDELPEEELKAYWQDKLKILDKFYRKFAAKYHPDKSNNILKDEKLANELFTSLRAKYERALSSWLDALNGDVDFEKEMQDLLRKYDEVIKMAWEVIRELQDINKKKYETLQKQDEIIQQQDEVRQQQNELREKQREYIKKVDECCAEGKRLKREADSIQARLERLEALSSQEIGYEQDIQLDEEEAPYASPRPA